MVLKVVLGPGGIKKETKGLQENIKKENKMDFGLAFIQMVKKNMKGSIQMDSKQEIGFILIKKVKKN